MSNVRGHLCRSRNSCAPSGSAVIMGGGKHPKGPTTPATDRDETDRERHRDRERGRDRERERQRRTQRAFSGANTASTPTHRARVYRAPT